MSTPTLILPHRAAQALSAASKGEEIRPMILVVRTFLHTEVAFRLYAGVGSPSGHGAINCKYG